jgi:uncharacterized protein
MTRPAISGPVGRVRAFGYFVISVIYFFFAQIVAAHAANGLASGDYAELAERGILLFLLLVGYAAMGRGFEGQPHPLQAMGLVFRPGGQREFGLGAALGWGMVIASILPMVLAGGLIVSAWTSPHQFVMLVLDLLVLAIAALAEEVAFRGYPFQRLIDAVGPTLATLILSGLFGLAHIFNPGANRGTIAVTVFTGWLLSIAYLRTRALWFSWGWHFAWNASMGVLFGLPVSGLTRFSPVIQSNTIGPEWITGSDYGPEGSLVTAIVVLVGIFVAVRLTRDYAYRFAQPVIVPGGMPVDLDAMSQVLAPHHTAPAAPAGEKLVQISPAFSSGASSGAIPPAPLPEPPRPQSIPQSPSHVDGTAESSAHDSGMPIPLDPPRREG